MLAFSYRVLDLSSGIDDLGQFKWKLSLCLAGAWLLVFVCLFRGIQTSGKVCVLHVLNYMNREKRKIDRSWLLISLC